MPVRRHRPVCALCHGRGGNRLGPKGTGFDLNIVLSQKAAATLVDRGEAMVIMVSYYGWPKRSAQKYADEIGQIGFSLCKEIAIPGHGGRRAPRAIHPYGCLEEPSMIRLAFQEGAGGYRYRIWASLFACFWPDLPPGGHADAE